MSEQNNTNDKMAQLDTLLAWFDGDEFELELALDKFTEAKKLADAIEQDLMSIKNKIMVVSEQFDRDKE